MEKGSKNSEEEKVSKLSRNKQMAEAETTGACFRMRGGPFAFVTQIEG